MVAIEEYERGWRRPFFDREGFQEASRRVIKVDIDLLGNGFQGITLPVKDGDQHLGYVITIGRDVYVPDRPKIFLHELVHIYRGIIHGQIFLQSESDRREEFQVLYETERFYAQNKDLVDGEFLRFEAGDVSL